MSTVIPGHFSGFIESEPGTQRLCRCRFAQTQTLGPGLRRDDNEMVAAKWVCTMLLLYQRDDCMLCDEAVALLAAVRTPEFESVWIDDDAELEARYGERVPLLRDEGSGRELGWPFDAAALREFFAVP